MDPRIVPGRRHAPVIALVAAALPLLAGCASAPAPQPMAAVQPQADSGREKVWARADGRRMAGNPALTRQGQQDLSECRTLAAIEGQPGKYVIPTLNDCMNGRGYVEIEKPS